MVKNLFRRILFSVATIMSIFAFVGCTSTVQPANSDFSLTIASLQNSYSVDEDIELEAALTNLTNHNFEIQYSASVIFIYLEGASEGSISEPNEGIFHRKESFTKTRTFSFQTAGDYVVNVYAEFWINSQKYEYSESVTLHVV